LAAGFGSGFAGEEGGEVVCAVDCPASVDLAGVESNADCGGAGGGAGRFAGVEGEDAVAEPDGVSFVAGVELGELSEHPLKLVANKMPTNNIALAAKLQRNMPTILLIDFIISPIRIRRPRRVSLFGRRHIESNRR
jgi:hypothetical protein